MSRNHAFLLVDASEHSPAEYMNLLNHRDAIHVHDDLLWYINDSLFWIPTLNGALTAARVFRGWVDLLGAGPDHLELRGPWAAVDGERRPGRYHRLRFPRDETVDKFENIAALCTRATVSRGAQFVLHLGL